MDGARCRQEVEPQPPARRPSASVQRTERYGADGVLDLQRTAGNAAVSALLQRLSKDDEAAGTSPVLDVVGHGGGSPLAPDVRSDMESRLGGDFSGVRVHTDSAAAASAASVQASAYTVGNEVVFGSGAYSPDTAAGMHTIAHELTHVQQQAQGPVAGTDTGAGIAVSSPSDAFEQEAEVRAARALSSG